MRFKRTANKKPPERNCNKHSHSWRFLLPLPWPLSAVQREQRKRTSASLPKPPSPILHPLVPFCSQFLTEEEEEREELQRHRRPDPPPSPSSLLRCCANTKMHGKKHKSATHPPEHPSRLQPSKLKKHRAPPPYKYTVVTRPDAAIQYIYKQYVNKYNTLLYKYTVLTWVNVLYSISKQYVTSIVE